jgi:hypothetical protein
MPRVTLVCALLFAFTPFARQNQIKESLPEVPPPADIDAGLTETLGQAEQVFGDAIVRKDRQRLDRIVDPGYTLRISDYPEQSLPRSMWMDNVLNRLKAESFEHHHDAARKLADNLAVVSLLFTAKEVTNGKTASWNSYVVDFWKKRDENWQIIARYGNRLGDSPAPPRLELPPPGDIDSKLTQELRLLEQQLGEAAIHRDTKVLEGLVGSEYSLRLGDAPQLSVPRAVWMDNSRPQAPHPFKLESFNERYHAARKLNDKLAVVSFLLTQKATADGADRSGDFCEVDIWQKTKGKWQIIARYSTPIPKTTGTSTPIPK